MTLEQAIEILLPMLIRNFRQPTPVEHQAIKLGIEALKWIQNFRSLDDFDTCDPLPGETAN